MYLALRLTMLRDVIEEKFPIILDEAFAFYDNTKIENMLNFFKSHFPDRQIIIFSCSNRELEVLDKLNFNYNLISL